MVSPFPEQVVMIPRVRFTLTAFAFTLTIALFAFCT